MLGVDTMLTNTSKSTWTPGLVVTSFSRLEKNLNSCGKNTENKLKERSKNKSEKRCAKQLSWNEEYKTMQERIDEMDIFEGMPEPDLSDRLMKDLWKVIDDPEWDIGE